MAYNKGDNNASRRRPMRRRKKVCAFCADKEHDYCLLYTSDAADE